MHPSDTEPGADNGDFMNSIGSLVRPDGSGMPDTMPTTDEGLAALGKVFQLRAAPPARQTPVLTLVHGSVASTTTPRGHLELATIPLPPPQPGLSYLGQIKEMTGLSVSPHLMAHALFRVRLSPATAGIDMRPEQFFNDREKETVEGLVRAISMGEKPRATLADATKLAIYKGTAWPLLHPLAPER